MSTVLFIHPCSTFLPPGGVADRHDADARSDSHYSRASPEGPVRAASGWISGCPIRTSPKPR